MRTFLIVALLGALTGVAFAEADVVVACDLSEVVMAVDGEEVFRLAMKDGLATQDGVLDSALADTSKTFWGFATYERVAKLVNSGVSFQRQKLQSAYSPAQTNGVFMIAIASGKGEAVQVVFGSPFSMAMHLPDGGCGHFGTLWISRIQRDWEPWSVDDKGI